MKPIVILIFMLMPLINSRKTEQESFIKHYKCLNILNPQIPSGDWKLEQRYEAFEKIHYLYYLVKKDTSYNLSFEVKSCESDLCNCRYTILEFIKKYSDTEYNYNLLMDYDTLYFYKQSKVNNEKIFIRGKYYYQYSNFEEMKKFKKCQLEYFREHLDSLVKIRGDSLPELPCY